MKLSESLLQAYRNADYAVLRPAPAPEIVLRIGEPSPVFDTVLARHAATTAALLTAHNPCSEIVSPEQNATAQARLLGDIAIGGWVSLSAEGRDPAGRWPAEPTLAVIGIERAAALTLAQRFAQNAFVWIELGSPPELVLA